MALRARPEAAAELVLPQRATSGSPARPTTIPVLPAPRARISPTASQIVEVFTFIGQHAFTLSGYPGVDQEEDKGNESIATHNDNAGKDTGDSNDLLLMLGSSWKLRGAPLFSGSQQPMFWGNGAPYSAIKISQKVT